MLSLDVQIDADVALSLSQCAVFATEVWRLMLRTHTTPTTTTTPIMQGGEALASVASPVLRPNALIPVDRVRL